MKKTAMMIAVAMFGTMTMNAFAAELPATDIKSTEKQIVWGEVVVEQPSAIVIDETVCVEPKTEEVPAIDEETVAAPEQTPAIDEETVAAPEQTPAIDEETVAAPEQTPAIDEEMAVLPAEIEILAEPVLVAANMEVVIHHILSTANGEVVYDETRTVAVGDILSTAALSCLTEENAGVLVMTSEVQEITIGEDTVEIILNYAFA